MKIRQSVCYPIMKPGDVSYDAFFGACAEIGYDAVEMWGRGDDFDEVVGTARTHGLAVASFTGHGGMGNGLNNRAYHDECERELRASIDVAAANDIPGMICFSGNRYEGAGDEECIDIAAEGLRRIAPYAEEKGVNLNLELLNSKRDHVGYQCDRTAWAVAVIERVDSPRVKVLYDIYHMQIMEGDVIETIRQNVQWIGHFHTAGVPGRHDMDETQELNYAAIARAIGETDYDLYVGHEFSPKADAIEALRKTFGVFDQN